VQRKVILRPQYVGWGVVSNVWGHYQKKMRHIIVKNHLPRVQYLEFYFLCISFMQQPVLMKTQ